MSRSKTAVFPSNREYSVENTKINILGLECVKYNVIDFCKYTLIIVLNLNPYLQINVESRS